MGTLSCTISGVSYNVKDDSSLNFEDVLEVRGTLTITIVDLAGTAVFTRGQPIVLSDSVLGTLYSGYVGSDQQNKYGPASTVVDHVLTCFDQQYLLDKRTNSTNYQNWYAGDIAVDFARTTLAGEGVTVAAGLHRDATDANFNTGNLSGTVGTLSDTDDGCLELAKAGSDVSINVNLALGTLANVTYAGGVLAPTLTSTVKLVSTLINSAGQNTVYMTIWTGSKTLATNNTLTFSVWVPSTNKEISATLDVVFSDGTRMNVGTNGNVYDQNQVPSYTFSGANLNDLSNYAQDKWYARTFTFPSGYNGKVATRLQVGIGGSSAGIFVAFFKNIVFAGTTVFATDVTSFQTTPYVDHASGGFLVSATSASLVQGFDPLLASYISTSINLSAVSLVRSSLVEWLALNPDLLTVYASYDGNSYLACANNSALPTLLAGSVASSLSLYFKLIWSAGSSTVTIGSSTSTISSDPTVYASISMLEAEVISAPNPSSAKSDVIASYGTQSALNTGTHTNTQALSNGDLTLSTLTRDWADHSTATQTLFSSASVTQSASSGAYVMSFPATGSALTLTYGVCRLDFVPITSDFTLDVDIKFSLTTSGSDSDQAGVTYRQIGWTSGNNNSFGYYVGIQTNNIQIGYGSNTNTGSDSYTQLATTSITASAGTTYHLKIVVNGNLHLVYFNNASTPTLRVVDGTYTYPGNIGFRGIGTNSSFSNTYDNLVVNPDPTGTWTSPSSSISALGTCGGSSIAWTEVNTSNTNTSSIIVQTSIDGGSSYQICANGATIPGLTSGTNVSGKSVRIQAILNTISQPVAPIVRGLYFRTIGTYPGSSGTRSTVPLGLDTMVRSNVVGGFGTGYDLQTYSKVGTGTVALTSDEATIANTTGDLHMVYGSRTGTDEEGTVRFSLSASSISGGIELRYVDANNLYRLSATTTTLTITKKVSGFSSTLATASIALSTGTFYRMRFRVTGNNPALLRGRVWTDGVLEKTTWDVMATG